MTAPGPFGAPGLSPALGADDGALEKHGPNYYLARGHPPPMSCALETGGLEDEPPPEIPRACAGGVCGPAQWCQSGLVCAAGTVPVVRRCKVECIGAKRSETMEASEKRKR